MLEFFPEPLVDEKQVRDAARHFANEVLRPTATEDDLASRFRREIFNRAVKEGITAVAIPKEYGGRGLSYRAYYASLEELARGSAAMTVAVSVTNLIQGAVAQFGNSEQKQSALRRLASGEWLGAFSLSEPGSGSDAASLRTAARKVQGGYRVAGTKMWCSSAGDADLYLLMARTAEHRTKGITSFLVPKETPGFRVGKLEKKLGLRSSSLAELIFEDAFLPESSRLGAEGEGLIVALSQLDAGRIAIGAVGAGLVTEAIERAWRYHKQRESDGVTFPEAVKQGLGRHFAQLQAVKGLIALAADVRQKGLPFTALASQCKLLGSDLAMQATSDAVEWMGEDGYRVECEVERLMRDAKSLQIVEGTNQIQGLVLARELERMLS